MNLKTSLLIGTAMAAGIYGGAILADSENPEQSTEPKTAEVTPAPLKSTMEVVQERIASIQAGPEPRDVTSFAPATDCVMNYGSWGGEWFNTMKKEAQFGCFEVDYFDLKKPMAEPSGRVFSVKNAWNAGHHKEQIESFISSQKTAGNFHNAKKICIIRSQSDYDPEFKTVLRRETYWVSNTCEVI